MSESHTVILCGTSEFAVPSLKALIDAEDFSVDLVITQPDKPVGRKQVLTPPPVKEVAEEHNLQIAQPEDINNFEILNSKFEFLVTVSYGQRIGNQLLALPSVAPVNIHPSLLPRWRGASPIQHAILEGEEETGVTIQRMVQELDAGPILAQLSVQIGEDETSSELHDRLATLSADLLLETLRKPLTEKEQDEASATFCHKLAREDGNVNQKDMTAEEIHRHVRALVPWPGVMCEIEGEEIKLLKTSLQHTDDAYQLSCKNDSSLYVVQLQPPGKKEMSGQAWMRGKQ